ncbi:hypothetical protein CAPTEDRAFT_77951, partial [Capitella teleta]
CETGWYYDRIGRNCYLDNEDELTWEDAREHCVSLGGDLASVAGPHDQSFMSELSWSSPSESHWIGGNEIDRSSGWKWSDDSPFGFFFWSKGEPNNYGGRPEWCIHPSVYKDTKWNDDICNISLSSIC